MSSSQIQRSSGTHDLWTIAAIALVAYVLAKVVHEVVGHAGACIWVGADVRAVSSSWCACDPSLLSRWAVRVIKAAGTLANLLAGVAFFAAVKKAPLRTGATYYFVWLSAAIHLLMGGGYLMVDPLVRFGDWGAFLEGLSPVVVWRFGLIVLGIGITLGSFFLLRRPFDQLLGHMPAQRKRVARLLCWFPYFVIGGVVMTGAALFNDLGPKYALTSALATLGGTFLLVWLPVAVDTSAMTGESFVIERSRRWYIVGIATAIFLFAWFGPGIALR